MDPNDAPALLTGILNSIPNPILIHVDGRVVFANDLILGLTGLSQEAVVGQSITDIFTDPAGTQENDVFRNLAEGKFTEEEEFGIRTANRKMVIKNLLVRNSRINYQGQDAILTILTDITERKHLEKYVLSRVIETEEKNRKQFAADLHDDLGPILSSIKLHLGLLEYAKTPEKFSETLGIINQQLAETIAKMRLIANNLMPRLIENFGLEAAVQAFINNMQTGEGFSINFVSNLKGKRFQKQTELHFYRIICELINNTIKHAGATEAAIRLDYRKEQLTLKYADNGKGYQVDMSSPKPGGLGIGNIIQRVNLLDATIRFESRKKKTTVIMVKET